MKIKSLANAQNAYEIDVIVQEGIQAKLSIMPENIRYKLRTTLSKIVNKGSNNMIAIVI